MEVLCVTFRAARLHTTVEKGFYTGRIEAVDLERHRYWVTFDRPGLGKHAILDTEIRVSTKKPIHVHMYTVHVYMYRIAGNFGERFNLAIWRSIAKPPD